MIARAVAALRDPAPFFRHLAQGPPRRWAAFSVLLLNALVSNAVAAVSLTRSSWPQVAQARALIEDAGVSLDSVVVGLLLLSPLTALATWLAVWGPIRAAAGRAARLWEVAAWSQLPSLAVSPLRVVASVGLSNGAFVAPLLILLAVLWSAAFVFTGVRDLSGGRARAAAIVHVVLWAALALLGLASSGTGGSSGILMG